jgi:hypothetical protein
MLFSKSALLVSGNTFKRTFFTDSLGQGEKMEVTEKELRERYETLDTDELFDLYRNSELTKLAQSVLKETLGKRGFDFDAFQEQATKQEKGENNLEGLREKRNIVLKLFIAFIIAFIAFGFCLVLLQAMGVSKSSAGGLGCVVGYFVFQFFTKILNKSSSIPETKDIAEVNNVSQKKSY